ncbi:ornithine carbamoyltransferase [Streptomyces capitiformicae]|uniref:Ornithine carbamoyltransferase n=1 Tax=Streptomyces capitiformicae TaxID=2014920 RepID=A0A918Z019_9ACTN|nr:ornithine carbamoyltransferase [Streptomyces capitiformicae]GHE31927.1 ornithine carbamoyltransferase [Streptomyces capitiformicae]
MNAGAVRHLISTHDLTDGELTSLVERGAEFSSGSLRGGDQLSGLVAGIHFLKTSTRTRTSFSAAALRLGAQIVSFGPDDLQTNTGETLEDTAEVLSRMLDLLVVRTAGDPADLRVLAGQQRMAVINAMTADEHPTQAVADLVTLLCRFGRIEGLRVCYVGEGNNTAAALALTLSRFKGVHLELRTPPGYGLEASVLRDAVAHASNSGATVVEFHTMDGAADGFDVIYTTRWQTTGTNKPDPDWRNVFAPFQVTSALWDKSPHAVFLHDLPAHRGEDVTAEVLDGPHSLAFGQAENKMYAAMAVLEWCANRR